MQIEITGIGSEFQGVGRAEDGRAAFIPGALPGEQVESSIWKMADRFVECRLEQVISPSPLRIQPMCEFYGRCGGCKAQHVEYAEGLALKRQIVEQTIRRIGGLADPRWARNIPGATATRANSPSRPTTPAARPSSACARQAATCWFR